MQCGLLEKCFSICALVAVSPLAVFGKSIFSGVSDAVHPWFLICSRMAAFTDTVFGQIWGGVVQSATVGE